MATAPSLFGATPESIQQARDAALNKEANAYAQLDPFQRASAGLYRGGSQLGGAIGRMLGGQDPEMMRMQQRQALLQGLDQTDPQSWLSVASKLSGANDFAGAQEAVAKAQQLRAAGTQNRLDEATIGSKLSEKSTPEMKNAAAVAGSKAQPGTPEFTAAYKTELARLTTKEGTRDQIKEVGVALGSNKPVYTVQTAAGIQQVTFEQDETGKQVMKPYVGAVDRTTAKVSASATTVGENQFAKNLGGGQADSLLASQILAQDASNILDTNKTARSLLKAGAITGTGADFFVALNSGLKQAGIDFGYADAAANSQAYSAALGANVGRIIKQFGAGTGLSDADRAYAEQMAAGKISINRAAIDKILDINDKAAKGVINRHNKAASGVKSQIPLTVDLPSEGSSGASGNNEEALYQAYKRKQQGG
jgi:hypothetical protein